MNNLGWSVQLLGRAPVLLLFLVSYDILHSVQVLSLICYDVFNCIKLFHLIYDVFYLVASFKCRFHSPSGN